MTLLGGCFDPDQTGEVDTETDTMSSSTGPSPSSEGTIPTATDPTTGPTTDPTVDPDSSDGTMDLPPTVELLVDGSATPTDVESSRQVLLSADVTDDGTVTRVDFYDGGELIGSDATEPFETPLLLTSIDNGAHTLNAIAIDDAGQEGDSGPVGLAVNIMAGATAASETNLFQMGGVFFHPGIGAVIDGDDNVIVAGSLSTTDFEVTGLGVTSLSSDLSSTNWQVSVPMSLTVGQPQFLTMGQPHLSADGSAVLMGGNAMGVDGIISNNTSIFRVAADGSGPLPFVEFASDPKVQNVPLPGLTVDPDGNVLLAGPDDNITKVMPMGGGTLWESPVGGAFTLADLGGHRMRSDAEGDLIFDSFVCDNMLDTCTLRTRKINGFDGNELWTQDIEVSDDTFFMHVGGSAPGPDGNVVTVHGPPLTDGGGLHMVLRDENGSTLQNLVLSGEGDTFSVADVAYDAQGQIVAVGTRLVGGDTTDRIPFAIRFDEQGNVHWQRTFNFGMMNDQAMALTLDRHGHLVVVGIANIEFIFVVFLGDVWVAQLDL